MLILNLKAYDILIGDLAASFSEFFKKNHYSKIAILTDGNTRRHCLPLILEHIGEVAGIIEIPAGELHKNLDTCRLIWQEMMRLSLDRRSLLVNLGGGVISDMGGFCAATYLRGIDFVQIPTTLLAQVDASIGGKLGIDFNFIKNSIGVFQQPKAVFTAPVFLKTLPLDELRSGFAEMLKHALIADAELWRVLKKIPKLDGVDWAALLIPSLSIKKQIVEEDPTEKGIRKTLNFGHTIGHAMEGLSLQHKSSPLRHGEAVAIGIVCESWLSHQLCGLPAKDLMDITAFIRRYFPPWPLAEVAAPSIFEWMKKDKKNACGRINFTLLTAVGAAVIDQFCEEALIAQSLRFYQSHILEFG